METETKISVREKVKTIALGLLLILSLGGGCYLIGSDMQDLLRWDLCLMLLNISVLPLVFTIFKAFWGRGYMFGRIIGLALVGYLQWLLSSLHIMKFSFAGIGVSFIFVTLVIYTASFFISKNRTDFDLWNTIDEALKTIIPSEIVFLFVIVVITWFLGLKIPGYSTERLMDYGFMRTLIDTDYMPPLDMWAAGETVNYYYFGQYLITFLAKMAHVSVEYGYSLGMDTVASICIVLTFVLVINLLLAAGVSKKIAGICGCLSSLLISFGGNFHYIVFYKLIPALWDMLKLEGDKPSYWFADSTRYIGYTPYVEEDRTIHEFPAYSFLIGDLHGHVIDIMIVLTILGVIISYVYRNRQDRNNNTLKNRLLNPNIIIIAFLLGIATMTNYWDFYIYYVVSGAVILFTNLSVDSKPLRAVCHTLIQGAFMLALIELISLPFNLKFVKMVSGVGACTYHSAFYQLVILWGIPTVLLLLWIVYLIIICRKDTERRGIYCLLNTARLFDVTVLLLGLCGVGLVCVPEVIYIRDIYEQGFPRANTMFKLTFQAFILLGICAGFIIGRILAHKNDEREGLRNYLTFRSLKIWTVVMGILLLCCCMYSVTASRQWYGDYSTWEYKGLDAMATVKEELGDTNLAIEWIENNTEPDDVVLQCEGSSYTLDDCVSALTGRPTVAGWQTHEWLWRNSYDYIYNREQEVIQVYTGTDIDTTKSILEKYNVDYIFIGTNEYEKYSYINTSDLLKLGRLVYTDNAYSRPTMIIKVE